MRERSGHVVKPNQGLSCSSYKLVAVRINKVVILQNLLDLAVHIQSYNLTTVGSVRCQSSVMVFAETRADAARPDVMGELY